MESQTYLLDAEQLNPQDWLAMQLRTEYFRITMEELIKNEYHSIKCVLTCHNGEQLVKSIFQGHTDVHYLMNSSTPTIISDMVERYLNFLAGVLVEYRMTTENEVEPYYFILNFLEHLRHFLERYPEGVMQLGVGEVCRIIEGHGNQVWDELLHEQKNDETEESENEESENLGDEESEME